eukprot:g2799.t1
MQSADDSVESNGSTAKRIDLLRGALSQLEGVGQSNYIASSRPNNRGRERKKGGGRTIRTRKNRDRVPATTARSIDSEIIDDLFGDLDPSMRVRSENSTKTTTSSAQLRPKMNVRMPVAMADADGAFTKKGMSRLVAEAKMRKQRAIRRAKAEKCERAIREKEVAMRAKEEAIALRETRRVARIEAAKRREIHRQTRPRVLDAETRESNAEERSDEMEALESMYDDDEFERVDELSFVLKIRDDARARISMTEMYPSSAPPRVSLEFDSEKIAELAEELDLSGRLEDIWMEREGSVVLFEWIEAVKEALEEEGQ